MKKIKIKMKYNLRTILPIDREGYIEETQGKLLINSGVADLIEEKKSKNVNKNNYQK